MDDLYHFHRSRTHLSATSRYFIVRKVRSRYHCQRIRRADVFRVSFVHLDSITDYHGTGFAHFNQIAHIRSCYQEMRVKEVIVAIICCLGLASALE